MPDFLASMAEASARRVSREKSLESLAALRRRALRTRAPRRMAPHHSGFDLIAEIKPRAPSSGWLLDERSRAPAHIASRAARYAAAGAAAVSVLTEPTVFRGGLDLLAAASHATTVPTMRKDFLVDTYQVFEARACGAGGVLLILRLLDDSRVFEMLDAASEASLFVLLEAFDEADLGRAARILARRSSGGEDGSLLLGLNSRDLSTLTADPRRFTRLSSRLPAGAGRVAESGIETPSDIERIAAAGYEFALVGGRLMRSADPGAVIRAMLERGRSARAAMRGA